MLVIYVLQLKKAAEVAKVEREKLVDESVTVKVKAMVEFILQLFLKEVEDLPHPIFLESVYFQLNHYVPKLAGGCAFRRVGLC